LVYVVRHRDRGSPSRWFAQTPSFADLLRLGLEPKERDRVLLRVRWPSLLAAAGYAIKGRPVTDPALRRLAFEAWWACLPLVVEYNVVFAAMLATALRRVQAAPERLEQEPQWNGLTAAETPSFDAHLMAILAPNQPPNGGPLFRYAVSRWFNDHFERLSAVHQQAHVELFMCPAGHRGRATCAQCLPRQDERKITTMLDPSMWLERQPPPVRETPALPVGITHVDRSTPAARLLLWLLHGRHPDVGVVRAATRHAEGVADLRFVNFAVLLPTLANYGVHTPLSDLDVTSERDALVAMDRFQDKVRHATTSFSSDLHAPMVYFEQSGWASSAPYTASCCGLYYESGLLTQLLGVDRAIKVLKTHRPKPMPPPTLVRRTVTRVYANPKSHASALIRMFRANPTGTRSEIYYELPFTIEGQHTEAPWRTGRSIQYRNTLFWTLSGLNALANAKLANGEPCYPEAVAFWRWAESTTLDLHSDSGFENARYDETYGARVKALHDGARAHLARWSVTEDLILDRWLAQHKPGAKIPTLAWEQLLSQLPGRTRRGVLVRIEALGRKYAFSNGYKAYMRSSYYRMFSAQRRKQWLAEGCPE
jgi:hypothetical protein